MGIRSCSRSSTNGASGALPDGTDGHRPQVGGVEARMLEEQVGHGRDQKHRHRAFGLHGVQPLTGIEGRLVDHPQPELHGGVDEREPGEGVGRAGVQPPATGPGRLGEGDHRGVVVSYRHCLRLPGGARGVEDLGQGVGLPRHLQVLGVVGQHLLPTLHAGGVHRLVPVGLVAIGVRPGDGHHQRRAPLGVAGEERLLGDRRRRAGVGQHAGHLGAGQLWVERNGHRPGPVDGGVGHDPAEGVGRLEVDGHPVPGLHSFRHQTSGQTAGVRIPLGEGERCSGHQLIRGLLTEGECHRVQLFGEQQGCRAHRCRPRATSCCREAGAPASPPAGGAGRAPRGSGRPPGPVSTRPPATWWPPGEGSGRWCTRTRSVRTPAR